MMINVKKRRLSLLFFDLRFVKNPTFNYCKIYKLILTFIKFYYIIFHQDYILWLFIIYCFFTFRTLNSYYFAASASANLANEANTVPTATSFLPKYATVLIAVQFAHSL